MISDEIYIDKTDKFSEVYFVIESIDRDIDGNNLIVRTKCLDTTNCYYKYSYEWKHFEQHLTIGDIKKADEIETTKILLLGYR